MGSYRSAHLIATEGVSREWTHLKNWGMGSVRVEMGPEYQKATHRFLINIIFMQRSLENVMGASGNIGSLRVV